LNPLSFISVLPFTLASPLATAQERPPANFENWGVCPFECCVYRDWVANADIPVHASRSYKSPVVFHLHKQEKLRAVTGVVVTEKPGVVLIDKSIRDGYIKGIDKPQLSLNPGDKIYMLSPLGEGAYLFWFKGKVYSSSIDLATMPGVDGKDAKMTWWKQVENQKGKRGWTTSEAFSNADGCG